MIAWKGAGDAGRSCDRPRWKQSEAYEVMVRSSACAHRRRAVSLTAMKNGKVEDPVRKRKLPMSIGSILELVKEGGRRCDHWIGAGTTNRKVKGG